MVQVKCVCIRIVNSDSGGMNGNNFWLLLFGGRHIPDYTVFDDIACPFFFFIVSLHSNCTPAQSRSAFQLSMSYTDSHQYFSAMYFSCNFMIPFFSYLSSFHFRERSFKFNIFSSHDAHAHKLVDYR